MSLQQQLQIKTLTAGKTEVLEESSTQTKPASEGKRIPYETKSTQSRGQSTSHLQSTSKTTPTLLTKQLLKYNWRNKTIFTIIKNMYHLNTGLVSYLGPRCIRKSWGIDIEAGHFNCIGSYEIQCRSEYHTSPVFW